MSRNRNSNTSRRRKASSNKSSNWWIFLVAFIVIGAMGWIIYTITHPSGYQFKRADLDKYIEATHNEPRLGDGASVYFDMSDGMYFAWASNTNQSILKAVVDKLAANNAIQFWGLASGNISPLNLSHTQLFNQMTNPKSYAKQQAPIEKTLNTIVSKEQPALLVTDFEEYKGNVIEKAAYAKKYFIEWLAKGYNITFYKRDFVEKGISKHLFLAVFDDNAKRLTALVDDAVQRADSTIDMYTLGSREYAFPTSVQYLSLKQGGNYHNSKGQDIVTAVLEDGSAESYVSYAQPYATAAGTAGHFAPLDKLVGAYAEYYPIGVDWKSAIQNSRQMQEIGVPSEDIYKHLLTNLYINFGAQDGFEINQVEVRMFDMQETMKSVSEDSAKHISTWEGISKPEVNEILTASMESIPNMPSEWSLINVDFDPKFDGTFTSKTSPTNIFKANIVISEVRPILENVDGFFLWDNNPSLANSIKETLTASSSNPCGRVLFTYYIRTISD
jgi:hypothetical protein